MHRNRWIIGLGLCLLLAAGSGCAPQAGRSDATGNTANSGRYGANTLEIGPGAILDKVPQWDNNNIDVDGDGDREHLSGRNTILNPGVDLRSFAHPNGGSDLTAGVYPYTFAADRVADLARSVDGVANARSLLIGTTAILGMNLEHGVKGQQAADIVQLVRQRVLVQAPEFKRVHITTDRNLVRQIQNLSDDVRAGHSLSEGSEAIRMLTDRIPAIAPDASPAVPAK